MERKIVRKQLDPEVALPSHQQQHSYAFHIQHEEVIDLWCPEDAGPGFQPTNSSYSPLSPVLAWVHITRPTTFQTWWHLEYTPYELRESTSVPYAPWMPWPRLCWFSAVPTYDDAGNITNFTWEILETNSGSDPWSGNDWDGINDTEGWNWNGANEFYHTLDKSSTPGELLNNPYVQTMPMFHVEPGWYHVHAQFGPSKCLRGLASLRVFHVTHSFGRDATPITDVSYADFPTEEDPNKVKAGLPTSGDLGLTEQEWIAGGFPGYG